MSDGLFMGVDIGTTGVKAVIFDIRGTQAGISYREYPMICLEPGMAEIEPEIILDALVKVVRESIGQLDDRKINLKAIGLSTQMHSFLALDGEGGCITNVVTWADTRAIEQANGIRDNFDCKKMYFATGCRVQHPMYPLSKILWLKETRPEKFRNVRKVVTIKEYILFRMFGKYVIDFTDASASAFFDIHRFCWDDGILDEVLGIDAGMLGKPVECSFILEGMNKGLAAEMGVEPDIPVVIGSGDGILATVGCGCRDDSVASCSLGTSGALRVITDKPLLDPAQSTWCYCYTRERWVAGGAINNGGIVLKWLRNEYVKQFEHDMDKLGISDVYKLFDRFASEICPGSDGLLFLPFLAGERSPGWKADAKGMISGLQLMHGRKHFIRAAMEGVIYRMYSVFEAIGRLDGNIRQIRASGGYVSSDVWLQIQADIFGMDIEVAQSGEAAALGAAYAAMNALGAVKDGQLLPGMTPGRRIKPLKENLGVYKEGYRQFGELYKKLYA